MNLHLNVPDGVSGELVIGEHRFAVVLKGAKIEKEVDVIQHHTFGSMIGGSTTVREAVQYIDIRLVAVWLAATEEASPAKYEQLRRVVDLE